MGHAAVLVETAQILGAPCVVVQIADVLVTATGLLAVADDDKLAATAVVVVARATVSAVPAGLVVPIVEVPVVCHCLDIAVSKVVVQAVEAFVVVSHAAHAISCPSNA